MPVIDQLGVVTSKSGVLIVIDTGYLNLWSHDRTPAVPDGLLSNDEVTKRANSSVDLRIVGSDAERAGRLLGWSWHPLYVYDQPQGFSHLQVKLDEIVREDHLDARLEVVTPRIPHRKRADLALAQGSGAGEVQLHGISAVVIGNVPSDREMSVLAERSESNPDCLRRVVVDCRSQSPIARSERVGEVGVDYARLVIADLDAIGAWQHQESLDGKADYVFWGRDAHTVASALRAPQISPSEFGWLDLAEDLTQQRGTAVEEYCDKHGLKLAGDYRPHSDHWRAMTPTRKSPTESATIELAGNLICNFMTTWGDGLFAVHRDLSESGELVQIRIEFEQAPAEQLGHLTQ